MTGKRKKSGYSGGKTVTVAFSLCLLAVITMIGMYTVGRTDAQQEELEQQIAEAEDQARAAEEAQENLTPGEETNTQEEQIEEETKTTASSSTKRDRTSTSDSGTNTVIYGAELESDFAVADATEEWDLEDWEETGAEEIVTEGISLSFSPDTDMLLWPIAGSILMDYSMDQTVYFATLDQYKYNPAIVIQGNVNESVMSAAQGQVISIETKEDTGLTLTMDIGDGYEVVYGQLKDLTIDEGAYVNAGDVIGYVSEPTRYYVKEGVNIYFELLKDGEPVDPMDLLP